MFDESKEEVFIVEGNMNFYEHSTLQLSRLVPLFYFLLK